MHNRRGRAGARRRHLGGPLPQALYPPTFVVAPAPLNEPPDPGARTGIEIVDRASDALQADGLDDFFELLSLQKMEYGTAVDAVVPCRDDETDGATVEVLPVSACHGEHWRESEIPIWLRFRPGPSNSLFAVTGTRRSVLR